MCYFRSTNPPSPLEGLLGGGEMTKEECIKMIDMLSVKQKVVVIFVDKPSQEITQTIISPEVCKYWIQQIDSVGEGI